VSEENAMSEDRPDAGTLEPLVGDWSVTARFPGIEPVVSGRTSFSWLLGRRFLVQTSRVDHPEVPDSHSVYAPDDERPGGFVQHYFDSLGVVRNYAVTFDGRTWIRLRQAADFSPLDFAQRFVGTLGEDGDVIEARWETARDGAEWDRDFTLTYRRIR